jgi:hypothetical protein
VDSAAPDEVFGEEEELETGEEGGNVQRGLIRFDLSTLPANQPVGKVILRLNVIDDSTVFGVLSRVDGPWTEEATTFASAPPVGVPIGAVPSGTDGAIDLDVTSAVTGPGVVEFYLTTSSTEGIDFASRENGVGGAQMLVTLGEPAGGPEREDPVMIGAGDIASCSSQGDDATASVIDAVVTNSAEAVVFTAGDNVYESGTASQFADCYEPSWGRHKGITRPTPGTRDYRTADASAYFGYFGEAAGAPGQGYYSYDFAGWHVVALNSNCDAVGGCEDGSPQEVWLEDDLAASDAQCTVAYWHEPLFSSGVSQGDADVLPLFDALYEAQAEVVINAADHVYERFASQDPSGSFDEAGGIRQFIVGTGGRSLEQFQDTAPNSQVRLNDDFGVLALSLLSDGYVWRFFTGGSELRDVGGGACH